MFLPAHLRKHLRLFYALVLGLLTSTHSVGQGTWTTFPTSCPDTVAGLGTMLSDGSVLMQIGGVHASRRWGKLTPDIYGSYIHGTWTEVAPMNNPRLYFSSTILRDGRLYVAGAEFPRRGDGEVYDPVANTWTLIPAIPPMTYIGDANCQLLPDGRVLQGTVTDTLCYYYNPVTNTYNPAPATHTSQSETSWVLLKDGSTLMANFIATTSERYIPSLGTWIADGTMPCVIWDTARDEIGSASLLPDGRAFFIGGKENTAYYTPSGGTAPGTWICGPHLPDTLQADDAAAAMMPDGKLLCIFFTPATGLLTDSTWFYEFDYLAGAFTRLTAPNGGRALQAPGFPFTFLDLPDGTVLCSSYSWPKQYIYTPAGAPLAAGRPAVDTVIPVTCDTFMATGTLFNGISQGAVYGDEFQMATNFPIIRMRVGSRVFYARTFNWNRTGVQTGSLPDTTYFTLPPGLPDSVCSLELIANGISSSGYPFAKCGVLRSAPLATAKDDMDIFPNPATGAATITFSALSAGEYKIRVVDMMGRQVAEQAGLTTAGVNKTILALDVLPGLYMVSLQWAGNTCYRKMVVQ